MIKRPFLFLVLSVFLISNLLFANDKPLGTANDYNLFVLKNLTHYGGDSEGAIAIGGNAELKSYGVGNHLPSGGNAQGYGIVVGGNLDFQNGQSNHGDVHVGGNANIAQSATIKDGHLVHPSNPIDFNAEETYLLSLSDHWKNLSANGTTTLQPWGRLDLYGSSNDLNIFYISSSTWKSTKEVSFHVSGSSKIILNIEGKSDRIPEDHGNFGSIFLNGASKTKIVWNFFEATDLSIKNISWQGSLLAPNASFTFASGNLEGILVIKSGSMTNYSAEVHNYPLEGDFPQPETDTPEKVIPLLECVVKNSDGSYTAHFGYNNPNDETIEIETGNDNGFSPGPKDRGQTTSFNPGRTGYFPSADFQVTWNGNTDLIWTLDGETVTASVSSPRCSEQVFFEKKWLDENGSVENTIPSDLPVDYKIEVTSEFGTATGVYNNQILTWTYNNTPNYSDNNGLWVPINGNYTVKEFNLPASYSEYEGTGTFTAVIPGGRASNPYNSNDVYGLHIIKNKKNPDVCATDWNITIGQDTSICQTEADSITTTVALSLTPNPGRAKVQTTWQLLFPDSSGNDNAKHYSNFEVTKDTVFTITGYWPGITSEDTKVELKFVVKVLDCDGDSVKAPVSRKFYWNESVCPAPPKEEADLSLRKTVDNESPENGDNVNFTIEVTNHGPKDAPGVIVTELLPQGLLFISSSASQGTYNASSGLWNVGMISNGSTAALSITAKVDAAQMSTSTFDLGSAADFNVFVLKDITQPSSDTEGKMAVGRNAELSNYSVGDKLSTFGDDVLVVGGNLTYNSGRVYNGNVVYGNSTNLPIGIASVDGDLIQGSPIDFAAAETYLKNLSAQIKSFVTNGSTTMEYSKLQLTGTDPFMNVFSVDGNDLANSTTMYINFPSGSVVLVNITGSSIDDWSGRIYLNNSEATNQPGNENILYNFPDANYIKITNIAVEGTILAPYANINFVSGQHNGQMIAEYLEGMAQYNNVKFIGNIPISALLTNVAEVYYSGIKDPDSTPNNGAVNEDDYDYAAVSINYSDNSTGGDNGGGSGSEQQWESIGSFGLDEIVYVLTNDIDGNILAGTWGGNIHRSTDDGQTWEKINEGMNAAFIWSIVINKSNGNIYAGTEKGIFVSEDSGSSWSQTGLKDVDVRAIGIDNDGYLYAGTWGLGIYKSIDGGAAWTEVNNGLDFKAVNSIVIDSNSDIYAATFGGGVYKSENHGELWVKLNVGYEHIWSLGITSTNNIYAGTYGEGVYFSKDGGNSWSKSNGGLPAVYVYAITVDSQDEVYISTWANGVYKSSNTGLTWNSFGLAGTAVSSLLLNTSTSQVYAGTSGGQILAVNKSVTSVENPDSIEELPKEFELSQNYPNPFNPATTIRFNIKDAGKYSLRVYNILGQLVTTLIDSEMNPGSYNITFDASKLASGIYLYNISGKNINITKKMVLIK